MYEDNEMDQEPDLIEMTDDEGNSITMEVVDYFFYNGDEYVILAEYSEEEPAEAEEPEQVDCFVMKVNTTVDSETGEELEEFVPVDDDALESRLIEVASSRLNGEDEDEEV